MDMTGVYRVAAPPAQVWAALTDPLVLKLCIPGCETVEKTSATDFEATAQLKIGPIKARFSGTVQLSDLVEPQSCTITGAGAGGVAGFAKGTAKLELDDRGGETEMTYIVEVQVGGKIAQLGARLIDGVAKKMADEFFARFAGQFAPAPSLPV